MLCEAGAAGFLGAHIIRIARQRHRCQSHQTQSAGADRSLTLRHKLTSQKQKRVEALTASTLDLIFITIQLECSAVNSENKNIDDCSVMLFYPFPRRRSNKAGTKIYIVYCFTCYFALKALQSVITRLFTPATHTSFNAIFARLYFIHSRFPPQSIQNVAICANCSSSAIK